MEYLKVASIYFAFLMHVCPNPHVPEKFENIEDALFHHG
jgi:hypothetical protein